MRSSEPSASRRAQIYAMIERYLGSLEIVVNILYKQ
jgi:hypothetical protein